MDSINALVNAYIFGGLIMLTLIAWLLWHRQNVQDRIIDRLDRELQQIRLKKNYK